MKILLYGRGWISKLFRQLCTDHDIVLGNRVHTYDTTYEEVQNIMPDRIVCMIGRTHGPGSSTIDYLEQEGKLQENVRDNLYAPVMLATICDRLGIHMTYLGTGCIYTYTDDTTIFTEDSIPNFHGSSYSTVKGYTDMMMRWYPRVLNARIRMPISSGSHPRNFITKIVSYAKICSIPNSMSVLDELLPLLLDMVVNRVTGTINLANPGKISHNEILTMYRNLVDTSFTWENFSKEEQATILAADRSNNELDTRRLQALYPTVHNIRDAVYRCLGSYR